MSAGSDELRDALHVLVRVQSGHNIAISTPELRPLWEAVDRGIVEFLSSELSLMETLVVPLKRGDSKLEADYDTLLGSSGIRSLPITSSVLRAAARFRATVQSLRTPDAIHAATVQSCGCSVFITNDVAFRRVPVIPVVILDNVLNRCGHQTRTAVGHNFARKSIQRNQIRSEHVSSGQ